MIGKLVSKETRTVYEKKVTRITIDVPYYKIEDRDIGDEEFNRWLDNRVGNEIGFEIKALVDEEQDSIN